jgi:hypothetical protein
MIKKPANPKGLQTVSPLVGSSHPSILGTAADYLIRFKTEIINLPELKKIPIHGLRKACLNPSVVMDYCYMILMQIHKMIGNPEIENFGEVSKIGLYFTRHNFFWIINFFDLISQDEFKTVAMQFYETSGYRS